jgi:hypothetical protein
MPLSNGKSYKAFQKNIKTEIEHGKPQKTAVAIAYSIQDRAKHKKHMDEGGSADGCQMCADDKMAGGGEADEQPMMDTKDPEMGEDIDSELNDMIGEELMNAIHSKDKKAIMDCLTAIVDMCRNKE